MALIKPIELLQEYLDGIDVADVANYPALETRKEINAHRLEFQLAIHAISLLMGDSNFLYGRYTRDRAKQKAGRKKARIQKFVDPEENNTAAYPKRKSYYVKKKKQLKKEDI